LRINIPTLLTLSRVLLIPLFIVLAPERPLLGAGVFIAASFTDVLDGYLARRLKAITKFGIIFDPIADKFLVIAALVLLVDMARLSVWVATMLIVRDFLVTALRVVALSKGMVMAAEVGGKLKTGAQFVGIICLVLGGEFLGVDLFDLGTALLWAAMVLAVVSAYQYTLSFWRRL
jgi:CDP-diacylglycerol--glycerol-3-phosphate 3-phosphatidyltransferase